MSIASCAAAAGASVLAYCLYKYTQKEPSYEFCHGSTYGALYLMSRLKGEYKNCLVPFGLLDNQKHPVFSGECFRGITDDGFNRDQTSWIDITWCDIAVGYSKRFPFSYDKVKKNLEEFIHDNDRSSRPPYATQYHPAYWNKVLLQIRQARAWDEPIFQRELKAGLLRWIQSEIDYFEAKGKDYADEKEWESISSRMQKMQAEMQQAPGFQLNEEDKRQILKTYPIVFLTPSSQMTLSASRLEYGTTENLKLGSQIRGIATEPEYMDEVKAFLHLQGLSKKVKVISFAALALEKLNHHIEQNNQNQSIS